MAALPQQAHSSTPAAGQRATEQTRPGSGLPFDPDHPPEQPPAGAHVMTWKIAYRIFTEHRPGPDGTCQAGTCRAAGSPWPCQPSELARTGLVEACRGIIGDGPGDGSGIRAA